MIKMNLNECVFSIAERHEIKDFIEKWHYSHNINGVKHSYCFKITKNDEIIASCIFGGIATHGVWMKYCDDERDIIELRRLVCIDDTPKNIESWFIGKCLRWLKVNTKIKKVLSYADNTYGHSGVIYRASNFKYLGQTKGDRMIDFNGRLYHTRTTHTTNKKRYLEPWQIRIVSALNSGEAVYIKTKPKNIYLYELKPTW
jgi:hypothetical protein